MWLATNFVDGYDRVGGIYSRQTERLMGFGASGY